jgi:flagellar protein FlaF
MGFETIIAATISIAVIITVAYIFISGSTTITETSAFAIRDSVSSYIDRVETSIEITSVTYDNTTNTVEASIYNSGNTRFADFERFDVFLYWSGGASYLEGSFTINSEIINPGIFDPHETLKLTLNNQSLDNITYILLVCTPNAICDSESFTGG